MYIPARTSSVETFHNVKEKQYPSGMSKITVCSRAIFKQAGTEEVNKPLWEQPSVSKAKNMNNEVRMDNLKRAKEKVFDIALLNQFDYFITWTLDKDKIDRYDAKAISTKLKKFLNNMQQRKNMDYMVIPEYHKDGAIHLHGLIRGDIKMVDSGTRVIPEHKKPVTIRTMKKNGYTEDSEGVYIVYNMPDWKLGHSTAIKTYGQASNTAKYMTKYITKDFKKIFGNFYYAGGNIKRDAPVKLYDVQYDDVNIEEYYIPEAQRGFKYLTLDEGDLSAISSEKTSTETADNNNTLGIRF